MKNKLTLIILGIFLLSCVYAIDIYAGEPFSFDLEEEFSYYSIIGNISVEVISHGTNVTIIPDKYAKDSNFTIIFYNELEEEISSGGGSNGGASSSGFKRQYIITPLQLQNGYKRSMFAQNSFVFNLTNQHIFYVEKIEGKQVFLRIESNPIYLTLNEGDEKEISTEGTCLYDLSIKVNKITSVYAEIELKQINKEIDCNVQETEPEQNKTATNQIIETICDARNGCEDDTPTYYYLIGLAIIFVVLGLILWKYKSSKKENIK